MTTSNDTSWDLSATELVHAAYRKVGYLFQGQTLDTEPLDNGIQALNSIITYLQTKGMPLWKRLTVSETPSATTQVYTVPAAVKVVQVILTDSSGSQWPLVEKSLYDFNRLPTSAAAGTPVHYTVQPTLSDSTVSIWPLTSDTGTIANNIIDIVYQKKFDGIISSGDTLDFPSYWELGIIHLLAWTLAPETGLPIQDAARLKAIADLAIEGASGYGDEDGSLLIQPDNNGRWGS